jgi:glycosyltransferase involved in cell wall biosynthesis
VKRLDRLGAPWMQTAAMLPTRWSPSCTGTLAFFESEGHALALARSFVPRLLRQRHPLVVVTCWLGDLAPRLSRTRRALYRCAYRGVDRVVVFSGNQAPILQDAYGIDSSKIRVVDFGVDVREVHGVAVSEDGGVVAVGRDAGRDWATFLAAVEGTDWPVHLATRPRSLEGLTLPPNVTMHGYVDRRRYLELLAGATVVVVPTLDRAYPTGQTVLLEAMALGKACIVTATAAMEGYLRPDVDCLTVGLGDIDALRQAIGELLGDPARRTRLGEQARASVAARFTAERMWSAIADVLSELDERDRAPR